MYGGLTVIIYALATHAPYGPVIESATLSLSVLFWAYGYDSKWLHDTALKKMGYMFSYILVAAGAVIKAVEWLR